MGTLLKTNMVDSFDQEIELEPLVNEDDDEVLKITTEEIPQVQKIAPKKSQCCSHIGLLFAVLSSLFFSLCSVVVKTLTNIHPVQLAFYRFIGVLLPSIPILIFSREKVFPKGKICILVVRSICGTVSLMSHFIAFRYLPLVDASVIIFSVPVFVAIFARIFLKEPCGIFHCVVISITLSGVILICRPSYLFENDGTITIYEKRHMWGAVAACSGVLFASFVYVALRILKTIHYSVILVNFSTIAIIVTGSITAYIGAFDIPESFEDRCWIVGLGVLSFMGQFFLTKALQLEHAGPVSIFRTCDVVFAFIWQLSFFHVSPTLVSCIGAFLVTTCVLLTGFRKILIDSNGKSTLKKIFCIKEN